MIHRYTLLPIIALFVCISFSGCGAGVAPAVAETEETIKPIVFLNNYAAGLEIARQEKKPTLMFFSVPGNAGSQRMMETTFCDDEIRRLAEWLVCIYVDGSQESALCESLGISSFPTIILSHTDGTEVHRLVGRQTSDQLAVQVHMLLQGIAMRPQVGTGR